MARGPTQREFYDALEARYGKAIADAFRQAVDDLRSAADLQRAVDAVRQGDSEALINALHLDPAAYNPMLDQVAAAYGESGQGASTYLPQLQGPTGARLVVRFNVRNPRAEAWLRDHSATLVTRILDDQRDAIRAALVAGLSRGDNPTTTALDIVGRLDRSTRSRSGGIIGLTAQQAGFVENARRELASGDPAALTNYLGRQARDRRFDRTVAKAIREGAALPAETQLKAVTSYSNRLLKLRGDVIGLHETFAAIGASKDEAYRQAIADGKIDVQAVTKTWRHFPNEHPREQHVAMQGAVVGFREPFIMPDGTRMQYPHDADAPVSHTAGCHCQCDYKVDFLRGIS